MLDEGLVRAAHLVAQLVEVGLPQMRLEGQCDIQVGMWAMLVCQLISPLATHRHFHALDGVQHQQAQLPVEHVEVQHLRKVGAGLERVCGVVGFEG